MLSAHKTGRGVIGFFESADEAKALCDNLIAIDKRSQEAWLAGGADGTGPSIYIQDPDGNTVELKGPPTD